MLAPGEVLVMGERISEAGTSVTHPAGRESSAQTYWLLFPFG